MSDPTVEKRKFLVAAGDETMRWTVNSYLETNFAGAMIVPAVDGSEALFKLGNDRPHVIFIDLNIAKTTAIRVVEWVLSNIKDHHVSTVILGPVPDNQIFVDQIVTGQVQFLPDWQTTEKLQAATFRALNYALVDQNAEFNLHYLNAGEILMSEGEKAKSVYILRNGKMTAFHKNEDKTEVFLGSIDTGEFVGEMAYINGEPRNACVRADEPCELIEIPLEHLDHVLYTKPAWSKALMVTLSKRIKKANSERLTNSRP